MLKKQRAQEITMGWFRKKPPASEPPKQEDDKPKKRSRWRADDDDEDGDIATPKRDRHGNDDEPV
jgi:hypothetical protein